MQLCDCTSFSLWETLTEQQQKHYFHVHSQTDSERCLGGQQNAHTAIAFLRSQELPGAEKPVGTLPAAQRLLLGAAAETGIKQNCRHCSLQSEFLLVFSGKEKMNFCLKMQMPFLLVLCMQK